MLVDIKIKLAYLQSTIEAIQWTLKQLNWRKNRHLFCIKSIFLSLFIFRGRVDFSYAKKSLFVLRVGGLPSHQYPLFCLMGLDISKNLNYVWKCEESRDRMYWTTLLISIFCVIKLCLKFFVGSKHTHTCK